MNYILDSKEVHGEDFTGETFRVLKEKEVRLYGDASQSDEEIGVGGVGQICRQRTLKRTLPRGWERIWLPVAKLSA